MSFSFLKSCLPREKKGIQVNLRETGFFLSLKTRIFFPIDRQDWKGLSVPRSCSFLHWIWNCHGIGWTSTKIRLQHIQRHHRSHQVSGFSSVMVMQCVWRGRVTCIACLQLWQLWIPTTEQNSGCCTSTRQTDSPEAPETNFLKCFNIALQKNAAPRSSQCMSLAAELHQRTLVMTVEGWRSFYSIQIWSCFCMWASVACQLKKAKQQYSVWKNSLCPRGLPAWLKANFIDFSHVFFCQHTLFGFLLANFPV